MAGKRKRPSRDTSTALKKKAKGGKSATGSPHPHGQFDEEQEFKIRAIVEETATHYRIEWEDDEETGQKFPSTWEPKGHANRLAVEDWEATKRRKREAARGVAQKTALPRARGRPRKTIESSPPALDTSPQANGNGSAVDARQENDLEIDESQPTVGGAEDSGASSPLFVPPDSPKPSGRREKAQPSVQVSDPPSSYAAGVYQDLSSSQVPESAVHQYQRASGSQEPESSQLPESEGFREQRASSPQPTAASQSETQREVQDQSARNKSPEPSQFQPEEGDTSRTTNDTGTTSTAPASSSEPTRSVPVNFAERTNNIVPDSQSLPDSSSFVPSGTGSKSSSAPEPRDPGRPPREVTQVSELQQTQGGEQSSWQGFSSQPRAGSPQAGVGSVAGNSQRRQSSLAPQGTQGSTVEDSAGVQVQSQASAGVSEQEQTASSQPAAAQDQHTGGRKSPSPPDSRPNDGQPSEPSQDLPSQFASQPETQDQNTLPAASKAPHQKSEVHSQSSPDSVAREQSQRAQASERGGVGVSDQAPEGAPNRTHNHNSSENDIRESTEQPYSRHVDLTADTQLPAGITSSLAVTPLPPRHTIAAQRNANNRPPGQDVSSPFPFKTQIQPTYNSTTSGAQTSPSAGFQTQPPAQSQSEIGVSEPSHSQPPNLLPGFSSPIQSSSPIAPAPSQSLGTFDLGQSAPHRPEIPSSLSRPSSSQSNMSTQLTGSVAEAREKVRAMRARHKAKLEAELNGSPTSAPAPRGPDTSPPKSSIPPHVAAETPVPNPAKLASPLLRAQDGARSPSVVPAMEALPEITTEEMNTSERYPTLLPQASIAEDGEATRNGALTGRATPNQQPSETVDPETASIHVVPISLVGHQRDQYPQMVYYHQGLIQKFLETRTPDQDTINKVERFVERVRAITLHPDLDNAETFTQYDVEPSDKAFWDVSCSAKFRFLKTLLHDLREQDMEVMFVLRNSRLRDILMTFLRGIDVPLVHREEDGQSDSSAALGKARTLRVSMLSDEADVLKDGQPRLIICLDNSVRPDEPLIRNLRQHDGHWAPFVSLVVPRSIEHVENHLSAALSDRARLRALVSGIQQLKAEAGRLERGQLNPTESASALAKYLLDDTGAAAWPLAGLSSLEDLDSQTESEIDPPENAASSPMVGAKRHRTGSDGAAGEDDLNKRARMAPAATDAPSAMPTTVNPLDVELTHISDSLNQPTQAITSSSTLKTPTEHHLQTLLIAAQTRADDLHAALSDLQYRHEDARTLLIRTTSERDQATASAAAVMDRMTKTLNSESHLRNERSTLKLQLDEARAALLNHTIPERAELETARQALAAAEKDRDLLARRLEQAKTDAEFLRARYQDASASAEREAAATADLSAQVARLRLQASGEQARLRQMGLDARTRAMEEENRKLKAVVREREAGLKVRDEEIGRLREAQRGRMGTRGASVPRSPMGSRQGSPAVGEVRERERGRGAAGLLHPLRNA